MIDPRPSPAAARPGRLALLGTGLALALILAPAALPAAPPTPPPAAAAGEVAAGAAGQELRQVDAARFAAMVAGDTAALQNVLGEDLSYTHSNGQVQDRAQFLQALASGKLRYESMAPADVRVRFYGTTGVVTGRVDMKVALDGRESAIAARYTAVYVRRDRRWQLVAWHSSPLAQAAR